jgi:hypothetical protein
MTHLPTALALLLTGATASPARACVPSKPDARVHVSFLAGSDLASLAKWAKESTCVNYVFESPLAGRRLAQGVILTVTGRDVGTIFELLLHSMNLRLYGRGTKRSIVAAGPETAQSKAANEREKADVDREKVLANIDAEIKRKDDSHYTITRRGADAIIASVSSIARTLRVVPESKGGKPLGFRLAGLKQRSVVTRFGFQNGDLVQALNGNDLTTPDKALEAYGKFRTAGAIQVSFVRMGKPLTVEVKIE